MENGGIRLEKSGQETLTEMAENGRMLEMGQNMRVSFCYYGLFSSYYITEAFVYLVRLTNRVFPTIL